MEHVVPMPTPTAQQRRGAKVTLVSGQDWPVPEHAVVNVEKEYAAENKMQVLANILALLNVEDEGDMDRYAALQQTYHSHKARHWHASLQYGREIDASFNLPTWDIAERDFAARGCFQPCYWKHYGVCKTHTHWSEIDKFARSMKRVTSGLSAAKFRSVLCFEPPPLAGSQRHRLYVWMGGGQEGPDGYQAYCVLIPAQDERGVEVFADVAWPSTTVLPRKMRLRMQLHRQIPEWHTAYGVGAIMKRLNDRAKLDDWTMFKVAFTIKDRYVFHVQTMTPMVHAPMPPPTELVKKNKRITIGDLDKSWSKWLDTVGTQSWHGPDAPDSCSGSDDTASAFPSDESVSSSSEGGHGDGPDVAKPTHDKRTRRLHELLDGDNDSRKQDCCLKIHNTTA
jgi:hypothetical protein